MNSNDIAYTAKVSAAVWMIRKARKISSLLGDRMPEEQQAIEEEIVAIGRKMYDEAWQQKTKPEVTHDPGENHELEAYIADVRMLVPDLERWFIVNDYHHRFTVEQSAERWQNHVNYLKGREQQ